MLGQSPRTKGGVKPLTARLILRAKPELELGVRASIYMTIVRCKIIEISLAFFFYFIFLDPGNLTQISTSIPTFQKI